MRMTGDEQQHPPRDQDLSKLTQRGTWIRNVLENMATEDDVIVYVTVERRCNVTTRCVASHIIRPEAFSSGGKHGRRGIEECYSELAVLPPGGMSHGAVPTHEFK